MSKYARTDLIKEPWRRWGLITTPSELPARHQVFSSYAIVLANQFPVDSLLHLGKHRSSYLANYDARQAHRHPNNLCRSICNTRNGSIALFEPYEGLWRDVGISSSTKSAVTSIAVNHFLRHWERATGNKWQKWRQNSIVNKLNYSIQWCVW